jgi:hypothetical protein
MQNKEINSFVVFGPTKRDPERIYDSLKKFFRSFEKPILIITSICGGWDEGARLYAKKHDDENVLLLVIKPDITNDIEEGYKLCNDWMQSIARYGVTEKGVSTSMSLDMMEKLKENKKKIFFNNFSSEVVKNEYM